jgi:hypothetical protein
VFSPIPRQAGIAPRGGRPPRSGNPLQATLVFRLGVGKHQRVFLGRRICHDRQKEKTMLWTIAVILLVLWALGLVTSYTIGGYIHILLVVAVIVAIIRLIQGRRVL